MIKRVAAVVLALVWGVIGAGQPWQRKVSFR